MECKHNTKESHQIIRKENKKGKRKEQKTTKQSENFKKYFPVYNYFKCYRLNSLIKRGTAAKWTEKQTERKDSSL